MEKEMEKEKNINIFSMNEVAMNQVIIHIHQDIIQKK